MMDRIGKLIPSLMVAFSVTFALTVIIIVRLANAVSLDVFADLMAAAVAFFALALAALGYVESQKTNRLEYRAYLRVDDATVTEMPNGCLRIGMEVVNLGRTPATSVKVSGSVNIRNLKSSTTMGFKDLSFELPFVNCGAATRWESDTFGGFPLDAVEQVRRHSAKVSLELTVNYIDAFSEAQRDPVSFHFAGADESGRLQPYVLV